MKVSVDYDGTLNRFETLQDYVKELIANNIEVYICTARYEDGSKNAFWGNASNNDLYDTALGCGIPFSNIIFTNMEEKSSYLEKLQPLWHLDDDDYIIKEINDLSTIKCFDVKNKYWKFYCESLIDIKTFIKILNK